MSRNTHPIPGLRSARSHSTRSIPAIRNAGCMLAILFAALFLAAGCVNVPSSEKLGQTNMTFSRFNNLADLTCLEINDPQPCYCMMCTNNTNFFARLKAFLSPYYDTTLFSGRCNISKCNEEEFVHKVTTNQSLPRVFMVGNGPSFASTGMANLYCNYSLQLATKWIASSSIREPRIPDTARAECWLDRDTLPLYIYYSNKSRMEKSYFDAIAQKFQDGNVGPALLTTEIELNGSDDVALIHGQIDALDTCDKCLTVLAVKSGDMAAVERIIGPPPADPTQPSTNPYYNKVDLIGFGFRANDYPTCSIDDVIGQNYIFSRDILRKYFKPTIWLYAGASEGNNSDGTCAWSAAKVRNFYQNLFALTSDLATSGVVGMSMYEFTDGTGPLPCTGVEGCNFGVLDSLGGQKHPELNTWSELCKYFGMAGYRTPLMFSRNAYGSKCDMFYTDKMYSVVSTEVNTQVGVDLAQGPVEKTNKIANLSCGEVCVSDTKMARPGIYDDATGNNKEFSTDISACLVYPMIDEMADSEDISATFVRSIIQHESGFNSSAMACTNFSNTACNELGLSMHDICTLGGIAQEDCPDECDIGMKPCAFGLMQCIEYPGAGYANPESVPYVSECGGASYNPFNPAMSICCGTRKFADNLRTAQANVESYWPDLSACSGGMAEAERGWATYYLASNMYYGSESISHALVGEFLSQRDADGECTGEQNYISFLRNHHFTDNEGPGNNLGAEFLSIYTDAVGKCGSDCPGK